MMTQQLRQFDFIRFSVKLIIRCIFLHETFGGTKPNMHLAENEKGFTSLKNIIQRVKTIHFILIVWLGLPPYGAIRALPGRPLPKPADRLVVTRQKRPKYAVKSAQS